MSQTETLLLFALGFSLAALIALFLGRLVWALAVRVGARRTRNQVPTTLAGLQAERDRLRAEYAMLSQRLTSRVEHVKMQMAEHLAEATRQRNRVESQAREIGERDATIAQRDNEIQNLRKQISILDGKLAAANAELTTVRSEINARDTENAELRSKVLIAQDALPAVAAGGGARPPQIGETQQRLKQRIAQLTGVTREIAQTREQVTEAGAVEPAELGPTYLEKLSEAQRETADLQKELERLDSEWSKKLSELEGQQGQPEAEKEKTEKPRAIANVISLASRIRALQKEIVKQ